MLPFRSKKRRTCLRHTRELFPVHHFMPQNMKRRVNVIREAVAQQFQQPSVDKPMEGALRASVIDKLVNENSGKGQEVSTSQADSLYLPLFEYISSVMKEDLSRKGPLFVGISAPQGAGKTTLTTVLQHLFQMDHKLCAVLSLDDFYLTFQDQCKLATKHSSNPLLQYRGNAGSHDLPLLESTLHDLGDVSDVCYIPRFDKSLNHGRGDRAPQDEWSVLHETPDVVLLEGWMLGFAPVKLNLSTEMNDVNTYLHNYREIHRMMDTWLVIEAEKLEYVYKWRQEAETQMSNKGLPCMNRFMPAYETYVPSLRQVCDSFVRRRSTSPSDYFLTTDVQNGPERDLEKRCCILEVSIDLDRRPVKASMRPLLTDEKKKTHAISKI